MSEKWSKGEPVKLAEMMRVMPLVQEVLQASADLNVSVSDLLWLVGKMTEDADGIYDSSSASSEINNDSACLQELFGMMEEEHGVAGIHEDETSEEESDINYAVSVKINGVERFPEVAFKAGITEKSDLIAFFEWLADMVDKMDN